ELGGGRFAQGVAALAALFAPIFLGMDRFYSMNAFDLLLWSWGTYLVLRALENGRPRAWLWLGVVVGLGLLNKISMLWFVGGLGAALLLTRYRRALLSPWPWLAVAVAAFLFHPYVVWQIHNGWPTLEFMRNATNLKMTQHSPAEFLKGQLLGLNVGSAPIWIAGLLFGLFSRESGRGRILSWMYLSVLVLLMVQGTSRASYLAPAYCGLFAMGAVAIERASAEGRRTWLRPATAVLTVAFGIVALPMALPLLPVGTFVRYQAALGMSPRTDERQQMGVLPQGYADMFGWEELTALVAKAYARLSPEERAHCRVFGQNYGEAGAIDVLGRRLGLPHAISGHNSYWYWGPGPGDWDVLIIIGGDRQDNAQFFEQIEIVGQTDSPWSMPYERGLDVSIARHPKLTLKEAWPKVRMLI
ncbi:MAG: glycosyltransferase family 39 protein, partial [Candidatus Eiseniibacteriota bacterium]